MSKGIKKVSKVVLHAISGVVLAAILLFLTLVMAISFPRVQSFVARQVVSYLSDRYGVEVSIDAVSFDNFSRIAAKELYVSDLEGDTLLYASKVSVLVDKQQLFAGGKFIPRKLEMRGGCFNLVTPVDSRKTNLDSLIEYVEAQLNIASTSSEPFVLEGIEVWQSRMRLQDHRAFKPQKSGINYDDMDLDIEHAKVGRLYVEGPLTSIQQVEDLTATDKSGAALQGSTIGELNISRGRVEARDAKLISSDTAIELRYLNIQAPTWRDYADFNSSVEMDIEVARSAVEATALEDFVPNIGNIGVDFKELTASYRGTVDSFSLRLTNALVGQSRLMLDGHIEGIIDPVHALYNIDTMALTTTAASAKEIYAKLTKEPLDEQIVEVIDRVDSLMVEASLQGRVNDVVLQTRLHTPHGDASLNGWVMTNNVVNELYFNGRVALNGVDVGHLIDNKSIGKSTLNARGELLVGKDFVDCHALADIDRLSIEGYDYRNIDLEALLKEGQLKATVHSDDRNLALTLDGEADLSWLVPQYNFTLSIERADLGAIAAAANPKAPRRTSWLSCNMEAAMESFNLDELSGRTTIHDLVYVSATDTLSTEMINIVANNDGKNSSISLYSSMASVDWNCRGGYGPMIDYIKQSVVGGLPLVGGKQKGPKGLADEAEGLVEAEQQPMEDVPQSVAAESYASLDMSLRSADDIVSVLIPDVEVAPDMSLRLDLSPSEDSFSLHAQSNYIKWGSYAASNVEILGGGGRGDEWVDVHTDRLFALGTEIPDVSLRTSVSQAEQVSLQLLFSDNYSTALSGRLTVDGTIAYDQQGEVVANARFDDSYVSFYNTQWALSPDAMLSYQKDRLCVDQLQLSSSRGDRVAIDGCISEGADEKIGLQLDNVRLDSFGLLLLDNEDHLRGVANGTMELYSLLSSPYGGGHISLSELEVDGVGIDELGIELQLPRKGGAMELLLTNEQEDSTLAKVQYDLKSQKYSGQVQMEQVELAMVGSLLESVVSDLEGEIAMDVKLSGQGSGTPTIDGAVDVKGLGAKLNATGAEYDFAPATIAFSKSVATLLPVGLTDAKGGSAELRGSVDLADLSNIKTSLRLELNALNLLELDASQSSGLYGSVNASGGVILSSADGQTDIDAAVEAVGGSTVSVLLQGNNDFAGADFVIFVSAQEQEDARLLQDQQLRAELAESTRQLQRPSNTNIDVNLRVNDDTEVRLVIDPVTDNVLVARGMADLSVTLDEQNEDIAIRGDYQISEGTYDFNFQNLISKQFSISPDSYIRWNGGPLDAQMDVSATYSVRTSLAPLLGTEISSSRNSTPVDCIVNLTGQLSAIDLSFDINVPTANTEYQGILSSYFSSQEMMATQFVYLLVMGKFYSDSDASTQGVNAAGSAGTAIGFDFLANQVSKLVSNDDYKFNLNYKLVGETTSAYGVDFQTEIIDDRLLLELEANVETGENTQTVNEQNQLSGGGSLTLMLDKSGNLQLKGFSRTIDRFDENQGLQENGLGIYFRRSFDSFGDLWRKKERDKSDENEKNNNFVPSTPEADVATEVGIEVGEDVGGAQVEVQTQATEIDEENKKE